MRIVMGQNDIHFVPNEEKMVYELLNLDST